MYRNNRDYSTKLTGRYADGAIVLRVDGGDTTILTIDCHVDDARQMRGLIKDERLGGNFPITIFR
ncbi:MAG TPA: hypothetical protein VEL51_14115 [Vicinamibacterales bacterium]|nr:hypothetical protein [Vicinamibacterales bacterium]